MLLKHCDKSPRKTKKKKINKSENDRFCFYHADEQSQSSKVNAIAVDNRSMQEVTTQHSSEVQTVPVTDFGYTPVNRYGT